MPAFGQGIGSETPLSDYAGQIYELEPNPAETAPADFPRRLSETGLYSNTATHETHPGLVPYSVNSPLWSDGAAKERFIGLPGELQIEFTEEGGLALSRGDRARQNIFARNPGWEP